MALRENDNSRLHYVEELAKVAGRNDYTVTHHEEPLRMTNGGLAATGLNNDVFSSAERNTVFDRTNASGVGPDSPGLNMRESHIEMIN